MSALDDIFLGFDEVFEACQEQTISRARAELAQLRWRVAMLDILEGDDGLAAANRLMDACERGDIPQQILPDVQMARNEMVALSADLQEANEELETYSKLGVILNASSAADVVGAVDALYTELSMSRERVAEQARQLEEAREIMQHFSHLRVASDRQLALDWIAAHPASQTAPRHFDMCPCVSAEHPVKPCSNGCWHFTPDGGHQCVNCGQPSAPQMDKAQ